MSTILSTVLLGSVLSVLGPTELSRDVGPTRDPRFFGTWCQPAAQDF